MANMRWTRLRRIALARKLGKRPRQIGYAYRIIAEIQAMLDAGLLVRGDDGRPTTVHRMSRLALATGLVESNLTVYANRNNPASLKLPHDAVGQDHGSVGIYQQQVGGARNSTANWGTTAACMGVESSTRKFVRAALKVDGLADMGDGAVCQRVQGSAFPDRYRGRINEANALIDAVLPYVQANR